MFRFNFPNHISFLITLLLISCLKLGLLASVRYTDYDGYLGLVIHLAHLGWDIWDTWTPGHIGYLGHWGKSWSL